MSTTTSEYQDFTGDEMLEPNESENDGSPNNKPERNVDESPNSELKRNFSCKICFEQYTKNKRFPITLNCGHTFCVVCVKSLCQDRRIIQCGICRKNTYSDYRKLGKNIDMIELMEFQHLMGTDEIEEEQKLDNLEEEQQEEWLGAEQFIGRSDLEEFYENLDLTEGMVRQTFPYSFAKARMERQLTKMRGDMKAIEAQLNSAVQTYRRVINEADSLHNQVIYEINQQNEDRDGLFSTLSNNNELLGRISPDVIIRIPSEDSDDLFSQHHPTTSQNNGRQRNRNNNNNHRRRRHPRSRPLGYQMQYTTQYPTIDGMQNQENRFEDWGSSSGWGSDDKEDESAEKQEKANNEQQQRPPQIRKNANTNWIIR